MRSLLAGLLALVAVYAAVSPAAALPPAYPDGCYVWKPQAPDLCGYGSYCSHPCGMVYGPNYCVYPSFPPFQGMLPPPQAPSAPTHPYARSPRDYFMYEDRGR
jgi:hypothetical protein